MNFESKYITFIDGDDYVDADFLLMINDINHCDMCFFDFNIVKNGIISRLTDCREREHNGKVFTLDSLFKTNINQVLMVSSCNKIYKKELFNELRYKDMYFEDSEISYILLSKCKSITIVGKPLYNTVEREDSITKTTSNKETTRCSICKL